MRRREFITLLVGAAASWPLAVGAQQSQPLIGVLAAPLSASCAPLVAALRQGLMEVGYVEGQNVGVEFLWAEGQYERLPAMAAELVARQVTVTATIGGIPSALAAKAATSVIPIVFSVAEDPVGRGLVASLARPGGNATGISFLSVELDRKRLELLREVMPNAAVIAVLLNPKNLQAETQARGIE